MSSSKQLFATITRRFAVAAGIGVVIGIGAWRLMPPIWIAHASIALPQESESQSLRDQLRASSSAGADVLVGLAGSRSVLVEIGKRTNLSPKQVDDALTVEPDPKSNQVIVSAQSRDHDMALRIVTAALDAMKALQERMQTNRESGNTVLIAETLTARKEELIQAEHELLTFQRGMKSAPKSLDDMQSQLATTLRDMGAKKTRLEIALRQADLVGKIGTDLPTGIPALDDIRKSYLSAQADLQIAQAKGGDLNPDVINARDRATVLHDLLQKEVTKYTQSVSSNVSPAIAGLQTDIETANWQADYLRTQIRLAAQEAIELDRLTQNAGTLRLVIQNLQQQYEQSRVQSDMFILTYSVVDPPYSEDQPANKSLVKNIAVALIASLSLATVFSLWTEVLRQPEAPPVVTPPTATTGA